MRKFSIPKSEPFNMKEWQKKYLNEEIPDNTTIKYKEDGESKEMDAGGAKRLPDEHPAKQAWVKQNDAGGEEGGEDQSQKMSGDDFTRRDDKPSSPSGDSTSSPKKPEGSNRFLAGNGDLKVQFLGSGPQDGEDEQEYEDRMNDYADELSKRLGGNSLSYYYDDTDTKIGSGTMFQDEDDLQTFVTNDGEVYHESEPYSGRFTQSQASQRKLQPGAANARMGAQIDYDKHRDQEKQASRDAASVRADVIRRIGPDAFKRLSYGELQKEYEKQRELNKQESKMPEKKFSIKEWKKRFLNEGQDIDKKLAQLTLDLLVKEKRPYREELYMSEWNRDIIKHHYGARLPRKYAKATKSMMSGSILSPLSKDDVYMDGNTLLMGDKTIMTIKSGTTWADVAKKLGLKVNKIVT